MAETRIVGVVHERGVGGAKSQGDTLWTLRMWFQPWRTAEGEMRSTQLDLWGPQVSDEDLKERRESLHAGDVVEILAKFDRASEKSTTVLAIVGKTDDPELVALGEKLREPVTFQHPVLGAFLLNRNVDWYEGTVVWRRRKISYCVHVDESEDTTTAFEPAARMFAERNERDAEMHEYAAGELLPLKNGAWLEDGALPVTREQIANKIALTGIVFRGNAFEAMYKDGGLFLGHVILVRGRVDGELIECCLAG